MFREWNFLLAEIWVLLALAALVGLIAGWLIWGGRAKNNTGADDIRRFQADLTREKGRDRTPTADPTDDVPPMQGGGYRRPAAVPIPSDPPASPALPTAEATPPPVAPPAVPDGIKPQGLGAPRDGCPDDLTRIKGIGATLEAFCNGLGVWHFDQIATWSAEEIIWVDDNLEGFEGNATRDNWVAQAKDLIADQTPAFAPHSGSVSGTGA